MLNLRELFGDRYRIGHDSSASTHAERNDPWMMTLPCLCGVIYPTAEDRLAVEIDYHGGLAKRIAALQCVTLWQDGDNERTFLFSLDQFEAVAKIVKPRRRRRQTPQQREASKSRLARYQFATSARATEEK